MTTPNWPVYPTRTVKLPDGRTDLDRRDYYGQQTFRELVSKLAPDIVFAFNDPQGVEHLCDPSEKRAYRLPKHFSRASGVSRP